MAKVTITIQDTDDDHIGTTVEFDPVLKCDENGNSLDHLTPAQTDAFDMLDAVFTIDNLTGIE